MERTVQVDLKNLPRIVELNDKIREVVKNSTWFERYGVDWLYIIACLPLAVFGLWTLGSEQFSRFAFGVFVLGCCHGIVTNKSGHLGAHGALCESPAWNKWWTYLFVEVLGAFSVKCADDIHVKCHHPHTNIIGLGDSSTWKAPMVPCYLYMFVTPLFVPILTPLVSVYSLVQTKNWKELVKFLISASAGFAFMAYLIVRVSGLSTSVAIATALLYRCVLAVPYIHINIFQHIGLPMYSQKNRPKRIYQMSTGVLNLSRNLFLDSTFGHGLVNCHVEHHLYPKLSDYMCLKVKPVVKEFLTQNGLPYNEESYTERLNLFIENYEELMIKAPPITHFVGLQ